MATISVLNPNQGSAAGGNPVTITGTALAGATSVRFGTTTAPFRVVTSTQITTTAPPGTGSVTVTVTTPGATSNGLTYTYATPAPHITALSPAQGSTAGGNPVIVTGTSFAATTNVSFGATAASYKVNSDTRITATAPPHPAGPVSLTVTTPSGTSNTAGYTYAAAPVVTGVDPGLGPAAGGNTVTVYGTGLSSAGSVTFGPGSATDIAVVSDNEITVTAPPGTGSVDVTVTTAGGSSPSDQGDPHYIYVPVPQITGLVPDQGATSGGTSIYISGSDLAYTDQVLFGSSPAVFAAFSDDVLLATSPPGPAGTVAVTVHSPGGTSGGLSFTYQP